MKRLTIPGAVRAPEIQIMLAGNLLSGVMSISVEQNSHYQADTWSAKVATTAPGGLTLDQWGSDMLKGELFVLQARLMPTDPWTLLLTGEADKIGIDVIGTEISLSGRDLTARLIEAKTQETFLNQTASEVATTLANRHGLTPVVTATNTLVDRYYSNDHDRISHDQFSRASTEWDLLAWLAQQEGYDLFVTGTELHFQPSADPMSAEPYVVMWDSATNTGDVTGLHLDRSLTLAKDVTVSVRSWSSREGRAFTKSSPLNATTSQTQSGKVQAYRYTFPNLTEDQAQKKADALREEITRHERTGTIEFPAELALTPRDILRIQGIGASWDQPYYVASISRTFDQGGTEETVSFKNHSPQSEAAAP